jgi:hypothetical protein
MGVDRFIAMNWTLKAAVICTMRRARVCVAVIVTACRVFGGLQYLKTEQDKYKAYVCTIEFGEPMDLVFDTVNGIFFTYTPILALIVLNIGIVVTVHMSNRDPTLVRSKQATTDKTIAMTTVLVVSVFIAFNIPKRLDHIFWTQWEGELTGEIILWQKLTHNVAIIFENANSITICTHLHQND